MAKTKRNIKKLNTEKVKVIPLGGIGEIGKNMTVVEYGDDIIVIDCGLGFPDDDMPGIDLVIPDIAYLEANRDKLRGVLLTHGHEDHIGAIPYLLRTLCPPVFGTPLTLGDFNINTFFRGSPIFAPSMQATRYVWVPLRWNSFTSTTPSPMPAHLQSAPLSALWYTTVILNWTPLPSMAT